MGEALRLIVTFDRELYLTVWTSIRFSVTSVVISSALAIPVGAVLARTRFPGRRMVTVLLSSLMALPTVVIALVLYGLLSRTGPLGYLGLLFSPLAVIIGQTVLCFPIIVTMTRTAVEAIEEETVETLITLGATPVRRMFALLREARSGIIAATLAGFGRAIGEIGISMMLGGNIRWQTRTITTAIALQSSRGQFELALGLGMVLIVVALTANVVLNMVADREP